MMTYECPYDGDDDNYLHSFVVVVMTMTFEWLGDNSNDDSDYHDTPSTLRTMKIKI